MTQDFFHQEVCLYSLSHTHMKGQHNRRLKSVPLKWLLNCALLFILMFGANVHSNQSNVYERYCAERGNELCNLESALRLCSIKHCPLTVSHVVFPPKIVAQTVSPDNNNSTVQISAKQSRTLNKPFSSPIGFCQLFHVLFQSGLLYSKENSDFGVSETHKNDKYCRLYTFPDI